MNKTKGLGIVTLAASLLGSGVWAAARAKGASEVPLTLTGCVIPGEAKDSFLITNLTVEGSTMAPARAYYRLDSAKKLKNQVGHRVEINGMADLGDLDKGKVKVKAEDGKLETQITSERQTVKTDTPIFGGTIGAKTMNAEIATYGFEVKSVRRLEGNCAHAAGGM